MTMIARNPLSRMFVLASMTIFANNAHAQNTNRQFQSRGLEVSIISITPSKNTVSATIQLKNISDNGQFVHYCAITAQVNATLNNGRTLTLNSGLVSGIDNSYAGQLQFCINGTDVQNMTYLMPNNSTVVSLTWYANTDQPISNDLSISFPFNVIARTVPAKDKDSDDPSAHAGPIHSAVINIPSFPLSAGH